MHKLYSLSVYAGITGSLSGNATSAISSSFAVTSSYAQSFDGFVNFPDGLVVTGSLNVSGSTTLSGSVRIVDGGDTLTFGSVGGATTLVNNNGQIRVQNYVFGNSTLSPNSDNNKSLGSAGLRWASANISAITGSLLGTSSWATNAVTASYFAGYISFPAGLDVTGSTSLNGNTTIIGTTTITGSLLVSSASRFTAPVTASAFSGPLTGSVFGTSSWASNATTSSFATTASYALSSNALLSKAGSITNTTFTGNPRRAPVNFTTPFASTNYAITISGEDSRAWSIEGKVVGGFTASANSNVGLAGTTYWIATVYGET